MFYGTVPYNIPGIHWFLCALQKHNPAIEEAGLTMPAKKLPGQISEKIQTKLLNIRTEHVAAKLVLADSLPLCIPNYTA